METKRRRIQKSVSLAPDMHDYITQRAAENHRPFSWQLDIMLEIARDFEDLQSQPVDSDTINKALDERIL